MFILFFFPHLVSANSWINFRDNCRGMKRKVPYSPDAFSLFQEREMADCAVKNNFNYFNREMARVVSVDAGSLANLVCEGSRVYKANESKLLSRETSVYIYIFLFLFFFTDERGTRTRTSTPTNSPTFLFRLRDFILFRRGSRDTFFSFCFLFYFFHASPV